MFSRNQTREGGATRVQRQILIVFRQRGRGGKGEVVARSTHQFSFSAIGFWFVFSCACSDEGSFKRGEGIASSRAHSCFPAISFVRRVLCACFAWHSPTDLQQADCAIYRSCPPRGNARVSRRKCCHENRKVGVSIMRSSRCYM